MYFSSFSKRDRFISETRSWLRKLATEANLSLRTSVSASPTGQETTNCELLLHCSLSSYKDLCVWALISNYLDYEVRDIFKVYLEDQYIQKFTGDKLQEEIFRLLLENEAQAILYITDSSFLWKTSDEFFGYLGQFKPKFQPKFKYKIRRDKNVTTPVNHSRHRGYRDKGSLGKNSISNKEVASDCWVTEKYYLKKEEEEAQRDSVQLIYGSLY